MAAERDSTTGESYARQMPDDSAPLASPLHYLGHRLRTLRRAKGLSQRELAGLAQVDPEQISRLEHAEPAQEPAAVVEACDHALGARGELVDLHTMIAEGAAPPTRDVGDGFYPHHPAGDPVPIPRQLPAAVTGFTGRAAELEALTGLLEQAARPDGTVVISAIDGTAGIGKTALQYFREGISREFGSWPGRMRFGVA